MNAPKKTQMAAVLAALAAAGGGGYLAAPSGESLSTAPDEAIVSEMIQRAALDDFRDAVTARLEEAEERREEAAQAARRGFGAPGGFLLRRALTDGGDAEVLSAQVGWCWVCDEPSVRAEPAAPVYLRRCVGCQRRWSAVGLGPNAHTLGAHYADAYYPGYRAAMESEP